MTMHFKGHTGEWVQNVDQRGFMSDINFSLYSENKMHSTYHLTMQTPLEVKRKIIHSNALAYILH